MYASQAQAHVVPAASMAVSAAPLFVPNYNQASDTSLLFQSSPKGPTISYKPQQFSVPPPSPNSPTLSCQSDNSMIMSTANSSFVSPPPPSAPGPNCPQGQGMPSGQQLGMSIDSIQVVPPMFQPQPLMSPQPYMSPCVRYTSFPLQQTMFSCLAIPDSQAGHIKTGLTGHGASPGHSPAPAMQLCQPVPEVGVPCQLNKVFSL